MREVAFHEYEAIRLEVAGWPPYQGFLARLNYALDPAKGWIATHVQAERGALFTHRNDSQTLVAVTILSPLDRPYGDDELYVLVRADLTHGEFEQKRAGGVAAAGIGTEAVRSTLIRAYQSRPERRVFIRVRTEHQGAQHIAERVGFAFVTNVEGARLIITEVVDDEDTNFYVMRHERGPS